MYSKKRNKMLIIYVRPKILKLTRDICLKRPLKIKACIGSTFRVSNSLTCKSKIKKASVLPNPANTIRKSNVILRLYFGNLRKLLSANVDVT